MMTRSLADYLKESQDRFINKLTAEGNTMEQRGFTRLGINVKTSISTRDGYFTAILQNISVGGVFLWTNKHIEIGELIEINIPLPDSPDKKNATVNAVAVRIMDNGVAFKFQVIDDNAQSALLHLTNSAHV